MRATLVSSGVLFALAVAYWFGADALPKSRLGGQVGADGLPKLLAISLAVLSAALAAQTLAYMRKERRAGAVAKPADADGDDNPHGWKSHARAFGLIAIGAVYLALLPHLGYAVSAALLLLVVSTYCGLKPSWRTLVFAVVGGAAFYIIFVRVLQVPLPAGLWPTLLG
ncbi:MAG: tripartite tricarboxylate transporter TctB family protein [Mesorhizobium sp.]